MKIFLYVVVALAISCGESTVKTATEQNHTISVIKTGKVDSDYTAKWAQVKKLKILPKSALKVVNSIYEDAKKHHNSPQVVKALIYKMVYLQNVEEDTLVKVHRLILDEIKNAPEPEKQLLHSMLAQQYWNYYQQNRYRFLNRTKITEMKKYDMKTWTLDKIIKEVERHYRLSLDNPELLKQVKIGDFEAILKPHYKTRDLHPTLYDFLMYRAVKFYENSESGLTKPAYYFTLNDKKYLAPTKEFIKLKIESKDAGNFEYKAIKLFQEWARSRINDTDKAPLIDLEMKRLDFVYKKGIFPDKRAVYEGILRSMAKKYAKQDITAEIQFRLAQLYLVLSAKYNPNTGRKYKGYKKIAYKICEKAQKDYKDSFGAENCKVLMNLIREPSFTMNLEGANPVGKPFKGLLTYQNINKIYIRVVPTTFKELRNRKSGYKGMNAYTRKKIVREFALNLPDDRDFNGYSTEIPFKGLKSGKYVVLLSSDTAFDPESSIIAYTALDVTNIAYIMKNTDKGLSLYVKNSDTGRALRNVSLGLYMQKWDRKRYVFRRVRTIRTNNKGYVKIAGGTMHHRSFNIKFSTKNDSYFPMGSFYTGYGYHPNEQRRTTYFFTDRKIYRPGQTLYFKALVTSRNRVNGKKTKILKNLSVGVALYDPNGQKVSRLRLNTNAFGTVHGTFILPSDGLNGQYRLTDGRGNAFFSVEEYKRPKFEVKFKKSAKEYRLGQKVKLTGIAKAYAGFNIDNADVKYRVVRTAFYPYPWYWFGYVPPAPSVEIKNGFTKTDAKGEFRVNFEARPDLSIDKAKKPAFRYTIYADVTDQNGETRSSTKAISLGYTGLVVSLGMDDANIDRRLKKYGMDVKSTNLNGEFMPATVGIKIYSLKTPNRIYRTKKWPKPDRFLIKKARYQKDYPYDEYRDENNIYKWKKDALIFDTTYKTTDEKGKTADEKKKLVLNDIDRWNTGKYVVEAVSKDRFGNEVKAVKYFTLFDSRAKTPPYKQLAWFTKIGKTTDVGDKAEFLVGSSDRDVRVMYEIIRRGRVRTREIRLNNSQKLISIPVKEADRGNFFVNFIFIRHNRVFKFDNTVEVPWTNKRLKIKFETFRDKIKPGQKEEWLLKISGPDRDGVLAEMVATMYDASLDAFRANNWVFSIFPRLGQGYMWRGDFPGVYSSYIGDHYQDYSIRQKAYDRLKWFGFHWRRYYGGRRRRMWKSMVAPVPRKGISGLGNVMADKMLEATAGEMKEQTVEKGRIGGSKQDEEDTGKEKKKETKPAPPVQIRSNFNETAFFYPGLKTDRDGNVIISFTAPESLTKWKMLGFAHTKDLKYGFVKKELVTQKDLMVIPNAPRFLREGDRIVFTAKVTNLADKKLTGSAKLMLFDAITMKPVDTMFGNQDANRAFTAEKGKSALLSWQLSVPYDIDAVTYRIVASAGDFSDGEEMALPILKNRTLVTETMPLPVRAGQTKTFKFKKLLNSGRSKTLKNHRLTLEFTSNPAWYAVQALPYLMEYPYECSEQTFSRYYANSLASFIVNANPKIKRVFDAWKATQSKALVSNLEKNKELKAIILKETPWVRDAYSETEQKRRIALLFDLNRMSNEMSRALRRLKQAQMPSGGWPWFNGGRESRWITQYIVTGFAHLYKLKVIDVRQNRVIWAMLQRAVDWLSRKVAKDYNYLVTHKRDLKKNHLGYMQIHYLYSMSYLKDLIKVPAGAKKAFDYYLAQSREYWPNYNKYGQGMIALYLNRYNDAKTANQVLDSIKEHFIESDEMGLYFKESYGYYWYNAPIQTHAMLIEAFDEIRHDEKTIDGLKTWLLKSKQTQNWKTTTATANAIYALLRTGFDWLSESKQATITIGNTRLVYHRNMQKSSMYDEKTDKKLKTRYVKPEAGTGYIKTAWTGDEINPDMGVVTVTNHNKLVAWGGVYWQYFEDLDKITFAKTPLVLKKQLFVEKTGDKGPVLKPISGPKSIGIKVGDRIKVRIVLRVDRDMEYVHMKDMRASSLEPENVISRYKWQDGLGYYESTKDTSTDFFFDYLRKGTYVFEYPLRVTHQGDFSNGITTIQCMYAPEFTSHSEGVRIRVK